MYDWLVRHFVPNADDVTNPKVRNAYGTLASVVGIAANLLLSMAKGIVGLAAGSISIVADAVNNLTDASSSVVSLIGFRLANRPADRGHPYGHGRIEYMAGVAVAFIILFVGVELMRTSFARIWSPEPTELAPVTVAVLLGSIAVKAWMAGFGRSLGRRIDSVTLEATATDSRNDVITTASVLAAAALGSVLGVDLDGWAGLGVGAFIAWSGIELVRDTLDPLLGQAPDPTLVRHIHDTIMSYPGVLGTHDLMVHDYGPGRKFASAHVEMAAEVDPIKSHETLDRIEHHFSDEENLPLVLHYDPIVTVDPHHRDMRNWISEQVKTIDPRLTIHDLRAVPNGGEDAGERGDANPDDVSETVFFDCVRPEGLGMSDEELCARICALVAKRYPSAVCRITVDDGYASAAR